jgi:dehydrogenase/reductase SDR family protein 12
MGFYRKTVFGLMGYMNFTNGGFRKHAASFRSQDLDLDLSGKHFVVSGANSGIGFSTAMGLAARGGTVHMLCRNPQRAEDAKLKIVEAHPAAADKVFVHIADLSKPTSLMQFAKDYRTAGHPLHALLHNGANHYGQRTVTDDGLEASFATNVFSIYLLTEELMPVLEQSGPGSRVIIVSSGGMLTEALHEDDLEAEHMKPYDGLQLYARNKRACVHMMETYAASKPAGEVEFYSMHPGWVDTPLVQEHLPSFRKKLEGKLRTPEEGADTLLWLAAAPKEALEANNVKPGDFVFDRRPASKSVWPCGVPGAKQIAQMMEYCKQKLEHFQKAGLASKL